MLADRHITALMHNARRRSREGNWIASLNIYRRIIDERPDFAPAYCELARLYLDRDDLKGARELLNKVAATDPNNTEALFLLGVVDYIEGNFEASLRSYRIVEKIDGLDSNLAMNIALVCEALGLHRDAIKHLEHAVACGEPNAKVYEVLSDLYRAVEDDAQAIRVLELAVSKFPTEASLHYNLGLAWLRGKKYVKAETSFQAANKLAPGDAGPLEELAGIYAKLKRIEDAAGILERLTKIDPLNVQHWLRLSRALCVTGDYKKSLEILEGAMQIMPDNTSIIKELDYVKGKMEGGRGAGDAPGEEVQ